MTTAASWLAYNPNDVKPGWIAFFVVLILVIATFLLWWSMTKQLKRIRVPHRAEFENEQRSPSGTDAASSGASSDDDGGTDPAASER